MSPFKPIHRHTSYLFPPSVDDWLPEQHLARFVVDVVEQPDLKEMERAYRGTGTEAFHPALLLSTLIYGYATGVFGSRKLERATYDSVAFRYVAANEHPALADPVDRLDVLLIHGLHRHEAHVRAGHRLADRLGVTRVVLVGLHVRFDELGRDQSHGVPEFLEFTGPVMETRARLQADQARREVSDGLPKLRARHPFREGHLPVPIHAMELEHVLCQVDTQCCNVHD